LLSGFQPPLWRKAVALGDPARNLFMAGSLLVYSGRPLQGMKFILGAYEAGLTEAELKLRRLR
jgi:hypothetical protein